MKTILTDIEGTTSSISFVKEVLFPYARRELPNFVRKHAHDAKVRYWLDQVQLELGSEIFNDEHLIETLLNWIDTDRKHTALKALQGMIWVAGYRDGDYAAHIYDDAAAMLKQWHADGYRIYVYSSGSVPAQKLFFAHTTAGDLTPLFSGYFDTEMGGKRDAESYRRIAAAIDTDPSDIVFLSDIVEELDAADEACLDTVLLDRLNDYPVPRRNEATHGHRRVESFKEINTI
ncbi:MAG: acireductone synthase [Arenimonas sp.]